MKNHQDASHSKIVPRIPKNTGPQWSKQTRAELLVTEDISQKGKMKTRQSAQLSCERSGPLRAKLLVIESITTRVWDHHILLLHTLCSPLHLPDGTIEQSATELVTWYLETWRAANTQGQDTRGHAYTCTRGHDLWEPLDITEVWEYITRIVASDQSVHSASYYRQVYFQDTD